jgi:hypothetical protein
LVQDLFKNLLPPEDVKSEGENDPGRDKFASLVEAVAAETLQPNPESHIDPTEDFAGPSSISSRSGADAVSTASEPNTASYGSREHASYDTNPGPAEFEEETATVIGSLEWSDNDDDDASDEEAGSESGESESVDDTTELAIQQTGGSQEKEDQVATNANGPDVVQSLDPVTDSEGMVGPPFSPTDTPENAVPPPANLEKEAESRPENHQIKSPQTGRSTLAEKRAKARLAEKDFREKHTASLRSLKTEAKALSFEEPQDKDVAQEDQKLTDPQGDAIPTDPQGIASPDAIQVLPDRDSQAVSKADSGRQPVSIIKSAANQQAPEVLIDACPKVAKPAQKPVIEEKPSVWFYVRVYVVALLVILYSSRRLIFDVPAGKFVLNEAELERRCSMICKDEIDAIKPAKESAKLDLKVALKRVAMLESELQVCSK